MPEDGDGEHLGRESLVGPASLEGRFEITLGVNPGNGSRYTGHVDIDRRGDTYHFHWYSPTDSYLGNGIRIGNVMVVGYALGRAPGTVAYCVRVSELEGVWTYGDATSLGRETLHPRAGAAGQGSATRSGARAECLPTIATREPLPADG
jgi:hypothetical protein